MVKKPGPRRMFLPRLPNRAVSMGPNAVPSKYGVLGSWRGSRPRVWQHAPPRVCSRHRLREPRSTTRNPRNDRGGKLRNLFRWREGDSRPLNPALRQIREWPFASEPVLDQICDGIAEEPDKAHAIFGPRYSGQSTILPYGLIDTPELTEKGAIVVVEPSHVKSVKYASLLGESSEMNLVWYSTRGTFLGAIGTEKLGPCECVVRSQPRYERGDADGFIKLLDRTLQYRSRHPQVTLIVGSETEDEEELFALLGGKAKVRVHRIPPRAN